MSTSPPRYGKGRLGNARGNGRESQVLPRGGLHLGGAQCGRGEEGAAGGEGKRIRCANRSKTDDGVDGTIEYAVARAGEGHPCV